MEKLKHVSPEYSQQLKDLASLLCTKTAEYHPSPYDIEDVNIGFDDMGCYHHPALRTEHVVDL